MLFFLVSFLAVTSPENLPTKIIDFLTLPKETGNILLLICRAYVGRAPVWQTSSALSSTKCLFPQSPLSLHPNTATRQIGEHP